MDPRHKPRFSLLDGLRGTAALVVMVHHFGGALGKKPIPHAWLSVDLFFLLSGFVLEHAYGEKLRSGMGVGQFMKLRLIRLYPLYFIGLSLGALSQLGSIPVAEPYGVGLFMIPNVFQANFWQLNGPGWSLFDEMVMNIIFAWALIRGVRMELFGALGVIGFILCKAHGLHMAGGWGRTDWYVGFIRVFIFFSLGAVLYRIPACRRIPELPRAILPFFEWLGGISYALYMVHYPVMMAVRNFLGATPVTVLEGMALSVALAAFLTREIDPAMRRGFARLFVIRKVPVAYHEPVSSGSAFSHTKSL